MTTPPILAVYTAWDTAPAWLAALREAAPEFEVRPWGEVDAPARIVACAVWHPPAEIFASAPNLRVVHSLGAGLDHLWRLGPALRGLPVLRLVDPVMTERLANFALLGVLLFQRRLDLYLRQQARFLWQRHDHPDAGETTVGVLGLGVMGQAIAAVLRRNGFKVAGWSRTARELPEVACRHGPAGLEATAAAADILVSVLPLTEATRGILDRHLFAAMRPGSYLLNAGRGDHLVVADLLAALDQGRLAGALLDVFAQEPLPPDDPLWRHPKVIVTPHTAAISNPRTAALAIAEGVRAVLRGERPANLAEPERGY